MKDLKRPGSRPALFDVLKERRESPGLKAFADQVFKATPENIDTLEQTVRRASSEKPKERE